ncbi:MAG: hypothetical protein KGI29_03905 [Pseudomonadota bacterium]|nr:hypothetical protein [Pseudomonadota bacterium]MDE3038094.1 hypothetical protein [Pseudomonadota bacterium]
MDISGHIASTAGALLEHMDAAMDFMFFQKDKQRSNEDEIEVNGVVLPRVVAMELKRQGIALSNYSAAELQAAIRACAFDSKLIDDEHGVTFFDRLELTDDEREQDNGEVIASPFHASFRERILEERAKKQHRRNGGGEESKDAGLLSCCA